jgi:Spy/CpxP family protein refolding chaperone
MKKKWWILLGSLVIIAVIGFTGVSHASRHFSNPMGPGHMYRLNLLSEELGLTEDQRAALKALIRNHRQEIKPLVKVVMAKKRALQELVLGENPDPAAIRQPRRTWAMRSPRRRSWDLRWRRRPNRF